MMTASPHWRRLRQAALKRDGYRCTVPGCFAPAPIVDHIVTRPSGFVVGHALRGCRSNIEERTQPST
jgi:5-methylcytosine-specific restriction endonuclease McrA